MNSILVFVLYELNAGEFITGLKSTIFPFLTLGTYLLCGSAWHIKINCLQSRTNFDRSQAQQIVLIFNTVMSFYRFYKQTRNPTTHQLSIERADWPKLHDMFKARDAHTWHEFPVRFPVEVCALNSLYINIFHGVVARIENRRAIKAKHVLLVIWYVQFCAGKTALALKRSCNFSRAKSNELAIADQQDMFFYMIHFEWRQVWF